MSSLLNTSVPKVDENMPDSEDAELLASLNAEVELSDGEADHYNIQGLVIHADLAETFKTWVKVKEDGYFFLTSYHGSAESGDPCHQVYGKHMHVIMFFPNSRMWNSTSIHNRLVRKQQGFKKCLYSHEKVHNLVGLYKYVLTCTSMFLLVLSTSY
jgi:hypothetical protein